MKGGKGGPPARGGRVIERERKWYGEKPSAEELASRAKEREKKQKAEQVREKVTLDNVKLAQGATDTDWGELPRFTPEDSEGFYQLLHGCNMEHWLHRVPDHTMQSIRIPLEIDAVKLMKKVFDHHATTGEIPTLGDASFAEAASLASLSDKLTAAIAEVGGAGFLRTSIRSFKDAPFLMPRFGAQIPLEEEALRREEAAECGDVDMGQAAVLNRRVTAIQRSVIQCLCVQSVEDCLLQFALSKRVQNDLANAMEDHAKGRPQTYDLYIREYAEFPIETELRAFVYDRKLTAITAHHDHLYVPFLDHHHQEVEREATRFANEIVIPALCGNLPHAASDRFCFDIAYKRGADGTYRFWCVELNCFAEIAGACMFHWQRDKAVLMGLPMQGGGGGPEFRYNKSVPRFDPFFASSHTRWMDDLLVRCLHLSLHWTP